MTISIFHTYFCPPDHLTSTGHARDRVLGHHLDPCFAECSGDSRLRPGTGDFRAPSKLLFRYPARSALLVCAHPNSADCRPRIVGQPLNSARFKSKRLLLQAKSRLRTQGFRRKPRSLLAARSCDVVARCNEKFSQMEMSSIDLVSSANSTRKENPICA